ncbi:hypothetical protein BDU57DRAFT_515183 [Ampelomyces quisqualis]|uniref:Uncharacterized protein n=1 Tax=Ampelomyces quisqualis TaxID=50730 RepID=A0A6A5QX43_AMPQU|nr:hypothetical protein BDU57DRAFT_515183 [Ampelomyces quisqualis]
MESMRLAIRPPLTKLRFFIAYSTRTISFKQGHHRLTLDSGIYCTCGPGPLLAGSGIHISSDRVRRGLLICSLRSAQLSSIGASLESGCMSPEERGVSACDVDEFDHVARCDTSSVERGVSAFDADEYDEIAGRVMPARVRDISASATTGPPDVTRRKSNSALCSVSQS